MPPISTSTVVPGFIGSTPSEVPHELVSRISLDMTLEPGDVILCGTSLGVLPMKPGSTVEVEIDGIGRLANTYG